MLEAYQAFADYKDIMTLSRRSSARSRPNGERATTLTYQGRDLDLAPPFRGARMTDLVSELVEEVTGLDTSPEDPATA